MQITRTTHINRRRLRLFGKGTDATALRPQSQHADLDKTCTPSLIVTPLLLIYVLGRNRVTMAIVSPFAYRFADLSVGRRRRPDHRRHTKEKVGHPAGRCVVKSSSCTTVSPWPERRPSPESKSAPTRPRVGKTREKSRSIGPTSDSHRLLIGYCRKQATTKSRYEPPTVPGKGSQP